MGSYDPCFSCPLPDCDDQSPACPAKAAWGRAERLRKHGLPVDPELAEAKRWYYREVYYPAYEARRTEAGLPAREWTAKRAAARREAAR